MKVAFVERISSRPVNKDQMGGYGVENRFGTGLRARLLEAQCRRNVPVLALGYAAAIFAKHGHEIEVISDGRMPDADLVIIYSSIVEARTEVLFAKKVKERIRARVGFIGPFASQVPDYYMGVADFIIEGEAEAALERIARGEIPRGRVKSAAPRNLDELPFPNWDPFPLDSYSYYPLILSKPFVTIQGSRGCSFTCRYCPYVAYYGNVRFRTVGNIISEIAWLRDRYHLRGTYFRDPLFGANREWLKELVEALARVNSGIEWGCETRLELLDEDLIDRMYGAGLRSINCGIESSDNGVLKQSDRRNLFQKVERIIDHCHKKGIRVIAFYVLGLLGDSQETVRQTIAYAKRLNTFAAKFTINTPYPGTPLFEEVEPLIVERDWERFNSCTPVFRHPVLSAEDLLALKERAYTEYYFRASYLMKNAWLLSRSWWKDLIVNRFQ